METTTVTKMERRTRPGLMPSLYLDFAGMPAVEGIFAEVEVTAPKTKTRVMNLSRMPGDDGWGIDATWVGSYPVHSNGFGARYLLVTKAGPELATLLDAEAAERGLVVY